MTTNPQAIQTDATDATTTPNQEKPVSPRDQAMQEILDKRKAELAPEPAEETTAGVDETTVKVEDQLVELKVNGRQVWKSKQEVEDAGGIAAIQKRLAAEDIMAQAAREKQELAQQKAELERLKRAWDQEKTKVVEPKKETNVRDMARSIVERIFSGDEEEAENAIADILSAQQPQPAISLDPQTVAQEAARQARWGIDLETAQERFETDFADIAGNPDLRNMADQKTVEIMAQNPDWLPSKVIAEAGKQVREFVKSINPAADPLAARDLEKKKLDLAPKTSARAPGKPETKPKTKEELFAEIQASRGQR